jgi:PAT family beta-lactamase induction signal transducer AmpG
VVKPLWSPFVDVLRTKRWWVLTMQILMAVTVALLAWLAPQGHFKIALILFTITAFCSATHDIAADGYYMLELDDHQQVWFVGIRNTFYRLAVIFGNGVLIPAAGMLQLWFRNQKAFTWSLVFYGMAALFIGIWLYHAYIMPRSAADKRHNTNAHEVAAGIVTAFRTFFQKLPRLRRFLHSE